MGNDHALLDIGQCYFYFNPRSRVGNDKFNYVWGGRGTGFQSTFPRGERLTAMDNSIAETKFQSTFPRGERPGYHVSAASFFHFNPRSRVGNDFIRSDTGTGD